MVVIADKSMLKKSALEFLNTAGTTTYASYAADSIKYGVTDIALISALGLDLGALKVTTTKAPATNAELANKQYVDLFLPLAGGTMSGALLMGANKVTSSSIPTTNNDLVNKAYVDSVAQGLTVKKSVKVASTVNVPLDAGGLAVNAEGQPLGFGLFVDGIQVNDGDRVLLKNQTTASQNGIYVMTELGTKLVRTDDMDASTEVRGAFTFVEAGTANINQGFVQTGGAIATIGTDAINFTQFSGTGSLAAGTGLTKSGNTLSLDEAHAKGLISVTDVSGDGSLAYNSSTGVITYTGPSAAEARAHISVTDTGGDGSLSYNSTTGVISYTGPSATEARAHISVTDVSGDGSLSYNSATGVISYTGPSATEVQAHLSVANTSGKDGLLEYKNGLYTFTGTDHTSLLGRLKQDGSSINFTTSGTQVLAEVKSSYVRGLLSASTSGIGSLAYNATTGAYTYVGPSATEVRSQIGTPTKVSGYGTLTYDAPSGVLSYTGVSDNEIRARLSVTDNGGDGSLSYDNTTGVISYTGPSATEVRNHFSTGTGVAIANGQISIGQAVGTGDDVSFNTVTTTSDERKKKNVEDLKNSDDLYKLRCVSFNWKDENADQRTKYGFIAQEVQKVLPSIVNDFGSHMGIDYLNLISLLVKEVQVLRKDVDKLSSVA